MSAIEFKVSDVINEISRDQYFVSILINVVSQTCTVNRKSVLIWGSEETSICTSISYDEFVISGEEFETLMESIPDINLSRYNDLAQAIYDIISLRGI